MPAPYSDNLYSDPDPVSPSQHPAEGADAGEDVDAQALSPSDGYFHNTDSQASGPAAAGSQHQQHHHQSSTVPFVPNVLVEDPTLRATESDPSKAAEAERERLLNTGPAASHSPHPGSSHHQQESSVASPSTSSAAPFTPQSSVSYPQLPTGSSVPSHQHRRSVEEDPATLFAPAASSEAASSDPHASQFATSTRRPRVDYPGQSDAPPAYTPTSPVANQPNYSTFASSPGVPTPASSTPMGAPEEQQHLLGGNPDPGKQPVWQRIKDSHDSGRLRKKLKTILGILVVLSILFIIFGSGSMSSGYRKRIIDHDPVQDPVLDHGDLDWSPPPTMDCLNNPHTFPKEAFTTHFGSDRYLEVRQEISKRDRHDDGRLPQVFGNVVIRPSEDSGSRGSIDVEVISSDEKLKADIKFEEHGHNQVLTVTTPRVLTWWKPHERPCMQVRITVWIPREALLNAFKTNTVQLNVGVSGGLVLGVEDSFEVSTVSGSIKAAEAGDNTDVNPYNLEAPKLSIESVSGTVRGWFPFYDSLNIETVSGSISADIGLKETSLKKKTSASLNIQSVSGTLRIKENLKEFMKSTEAANGVPVRDYMNRIETMSGSINADLVTASMTSVETVSGTTRLRLLPLLDKRWSDADWQPRIKTESTSGSINFELLEPIYADLGDVSDPASRFPKDKPKDGNNDDEGERSLKRRKISATDEVEEYKADKDTPLSFLNTTHESVSGTMRLKYPSSWEGKLKLTGVSSSFRVHGKGVEVSEHKGFLSRVVEGKKGDGKSSISVEEMSGSVNLLIGED